MAVLRTAWAALIAVSLIATAHAAPGEYQIKAVFLLNFSRFVEWPATTFESPDAPFVVGVFGEDPFGEDLDQVMQDETVHGRPIVVRRITSPQEAAQCQILFVHQWAGAPMSKVLDAIVATGTLTVSDDEGAAQRGAMIGLVTQNNRVKLQVDANRARDAGLTISSNLLRSAQIVNDGRSGS
jgi:hypothetical protein